MTRRTMAAPPSPLLQRATARLAELVAQGVTEHPGGKPPRVQWMTLAMNAKGLEGPEVDEACGGVEPMIDRWELGELEPTPAQVVLLAELCGVPVSFFYRDEDPAEIGPMTICSRRKIDGARCRRVSGEIVAPIVEHRRELAARAARRAGQAAAAIPPPVEGAQGALF